MSVAAAGIARHELKSAVQPALYTVDDVANLLQCSARNVWKMNDRGALPGEVRVGKLVRWRVSDINAWIQRGCKESA
jgi:excisionase family DNA binding protein